MVHQDFRASHWQNLVEDVISSMDVKKTSDVNLTDVFLLNNKIFLKELKHMNYKKLKNYYKNIIVIKLIMMK